MKNFLIIFLILNLSKIAKNLSISSLSISSSADCRKYTSGNLGITELLIKI